MLECFNETDFIISSDTVTMDIRTVYTYVWDDGCMCVWNSINKCVNESDKEWNEWIGSRIK